jgi:hypothetical protein
MHHSIGLVSQVRPKVGVSRLNMPLILLNCFGSLAPPRKFLQLPRHPRWRLSLDPVQLPNEQHGKAGAEQRPDRGNIEKHGGLHLKAREQAAEKRARDRAEAADAERVADAIGAQRRPNRLAPDLRISGPETGAASAIRRPSILTDGKLA